LGKTITFWLTVAVSVLALVASAILLVDYLRPAPVFCDLGGGCDTVKRTALARPFGIPTPAIGIAGMLAIALMALLPGRIARTTQLVLATFGALVAGGLFWVQWKLRVLCPYCATVDTSAILLCGLSFVRFHRTWDPPGGWAAPGGAVFALVAAVAAPTAIGWSRPLPAPKPSEVPASIADEIKQTGSGKVTIVDFVDFECPFCRMTHAELAPVVAARKDKLRVVRKNVPLRIHPHAADAARADACAESLGKGEEMAEALFSTPVEELTPEGCEKLATKLGLDLGRFQACVKDPATNDRIERDKQMFRSGEGHGLPTIWVNRIKLEGAQDRATLEHAIDEAAKRP
jgi:predicted DsbA family dithiol-disulfide isomerase/uncharacterized membrane protein